MSSQYVVKLRVATRPMETPDGQYLANVRANSQPMLAQ